MYRNKYSRYYLHYQTEGYKSTRFGPFATGCKKMRRPTTMYGKTDFSEIYDYQYYITKYPWIVNIHTDDDKAVLNHFVKVGLRKGYIAKSPRVYPKANPTSATYQNMLAAQKKKQLHDGTGLIVCIDPGHQAQGMLSKEPIAPGSSRTKYKVTYGARGSYSGKTEYQVNLEASLELKKVLEARGYTVVMTRTTNNVQLSNVQRSQIANKAKADIFIRIHCDGEDRGHSANGVSCVVAANGNPWLSSLVRTRGQSLGRFLLNGQTASTGQRQRGLIYSNEMTGINWSNMPTAIVEMGFMSNYTEDLNLARASYQQKIAEGLANGVDAYFMSIGK